MRLMLVGTTMMLALAVILFVRARIMNQQSIERDGLSRFRDSFRGRFPELLLAQTYQYLAERHGVVGPHYKVLPNDDLERVYGLVDLDLEDAVLVIADRAGARLPKSAELDELKTKGIRTVEDMLRFLEPFFRPEVVRG
ncbi:MAG: hypothetical protein IPP90_03335 [Gemmatimonadaceae bacterium]|nr:hypothetical protein [Gemmatimonadaceae bacterium]